MNLEAAITAAVIAGSAAFAAQAQAQGAYVPAPPVPNFVSPNRYYSYPPPGYRPQYQPQPQAMAPQQQQRPQMSEDQERARIMAEARAFTFFRTNLFREPSGWLPP